MFNKNFATKMNIENFVMKKFTGPYKSTYFAGSRQANFYLLRRRKLIFGSRSSYTLAVKTVGKYLG